MATNDNPYASPQSTTVDGVRLPPRLTITRMFALLVVGVAGGAALGALTNSVNGALSPQYFRDVMGWYGANIWASAVGQGALEGVIYGLAYGVIFIGIIAVASLRRCRFQIALRYVGVTFALAFAFWLIGGAIAVAFAWLFPNLCDSRFFGDDFTWPALGFYAWVRGSIWGAVCGGVCSVFLTNLIYAFRHRRANLLEFHSMKLGSQVNGPRNVAEAVISDGKVNTT